MISIKFEGYKGNTKVFKFKNSFEELLCSEFIALNSIAQKLKKIGDRVQSYELELKGLDNSNPMLLEAVLHIDNELMQLDQSIRALKIESLFVLALDKSISKYLLTTKGVVFAHIQAAFVATQKGFADFEQFVKVVKPLEVFKFQDYYKGHLLNFTKRKEFRVFDTTNQTVLRDAAANMVAAKIDGIREELEELEGSRWENLPRFVAYVARPSNEIDEISINDKNNFYGGRDIRTLSVEDRLEGYNRKLAKEVELRTEVFQKLPLALAVGVYKQFFFLSQR